VITNPSLGWSPVAIANGMRINMMNRRIHMMHEIQLETAAARQIVLIAMAYCEAQTATSGEESPMVLDRQWQACCGVAARFLSDPEAMTPQLCHHEWRLSQMRHSHPPFWPAAASRTWDELDPMDQYVERAGLAAMRQALNETRRPASGNTAALK
jgi:hypothetical protein